MANYAQPVASTVNDVEFSRFSAEEIKKISVKRIHVTPTFDTFGGPVPGGLYDQAMGAVLDKNCTTCHMSSIHCAGHPGHIELPVPCYHVMFLDQILRLLRAKCIFCHRLRMPAIVVNGFECKLRLLQYGLIEEARRLEREFRLQAGSATKKKKDDEDDEVEDPEDPEELMERRIRFTNRAILKLKKQDRSDRLLLLKHPAAIEERKATVRDFLSSIALISKCSFCSGWTPRYRKDRNSKIFKVPLGADRISDNKARGLKAVNPFVFLQQEKNAEEESRHKKKKPLTNGYRDSDSDTIMDSGSEDGHGAEDEIALNSGILAGGEENDDEDDDGSQSFMTGSEVHAALTLLFDRSPVFALVYSSRPLHRTSQPVNADMFFTTDILVPPNKFRPAAKQGDSVLEAMMNGALNKIIASNDQIALIRREMQASTAINGMRKRGFRELLSAVVDLQEAVNALIDQTPNPQAGRQNTNGIKQTLEKKEGLFRMNMMGKRVNFAARSVISPDPNIETNEIGVPLIFAKKLTFPEPVTSANLREMKQAVINGMKRYPGAAAIENERGQVLNLKFKNDDERVALANMLQTPTQGAKPGKTKKVYRHLQTGDMVIMNRQPTLHKPSMMGHKARVLQNEKTIRMHYANCNTYNADFDGDEMNMHFPQNQHARSEALQIADTDHQYLSATAGKPLRGLIQDHISMGVQFTSRDAFFTRDEYQELLYSCLRPEHSHTITDRIQMTPPALLKPEPRWTGKQVISTVLKNITPSGREGINLEGKSQTSATSWGEDSEEAKVIFQHGLLLTGILDKAQLGPTGGGLIHSAHELYGHIVAGRLLSILGRLLTRFLSMRAWTCGMDDLYLTKQGEIDRKETLSQTDKIGKEVAANYVTLDSQKTKKQDPELLSRLEDVLRDDSKQSGLDSVYNSRTAELSSEITKTCLPKALQKPFPRNQMQAMTISGAKGSSVNANLISCNLGQQVLEGRRVPVMVSGKTLPSFQAFETNVGAGGYVSGRFLTGINPKEYYFHAMAGREGLIDTAVKTSKSGYLQRCIVKGLEGQKVEYDGSVREAANGTMVQFLYGEDGLDITKQKHLQEFSFLAQNRHTVRAGLRLEDEFNYVARNIDVNEFKKIRKIMKDYPDKAEPLINKHAPHMHITSTSARFATAVDEYIKENPDKVIKEKRKDGGDMSKKTFQAMMDIKYLKSLVEPGEAVGVVAAQSVGEPSTQMTLNTFHLAGHSAKNVTLGIPRLREIVMTASDHIATPIMTVKCIDEMTTEHAQRFTKSISKVTLAEVIDSLSVMESTTQAHGYTTARVYDVHIVFYPKEEYLEEYAVNVDDMAATLQEKFMPNLNKLITAEIKKKQREKSTSTVSAAVPDIGVSVGRIEEEQSRGRSTNADVDVEGGEDDEREDIDPDDAKQVAARSRQVDDFDEPDSDEEAIAAASDDEAGSDGEHIQPKAKQSRTPQNLRDENPDEEEDTEQDSEEDDESRTRLDRLQGNYPHLAKFSFKTSSAQTLKLRLAYDNSTPKILLLPLVERATRSTIIHSLPGIGLCTLTTEKLKATQIDPSTGASIQAEENTITTAGSNLVAIRDLQDYLAPHTLKTNDIHAMLRLYGVEAARATIVQEIDSVFKGHSISVDYRHLALIADAMTQSGGYKAFSRNGLIKESGSVLGKMSFETVVGVLKEAVLNREIDPLEGPSARIVAGKRGVVGTGSFDVVVPMDGRIAVA